MAQVYFCEINTYEVSIGRSAGNSGPYGRTWQRLIKLNLTPGRMGNGVIQAELSFFEDLTHVDPVNIGGRNNSSILVSIPIYDYEHVYKLLRTERPLNISWQQLEAGNSSLINSWRISSSREPIAEGDSEV